MPNFAYVQSATGINTNTATFTSNTTANNCIIVISYGLGVPGTVTDTQGNIYTRIAWCWGWAGLSIFAATNISDGPNIVTVPGDNSVVSGIFIAEYSSINPTYWICPGHAEPGQGFNAQNNITSTDSGNSAGSGTGGYNWTSSEEVLAIFAGFAWSLGSITFSISSATTHFNGYIGDEASHYHDYGIAGEMSFSSVPTPFSNSTLEMSINGGASIPPYQSVCVMLNLTGACLGGIRTNIISLSCNTPPTAYIGVFYSNYLLASGGTAPYTWAIISGSLPPGLSMNTSTGLISGTPSNIRISGYKTFHFRFQVTDSVGNISAVSCSIVVGNYLAGLPCNSVT